MNAIEDLVLKIIDSNCPKLRPNNTDAAKAITELLEEYDRWKLENCEAGLDCWILMDVKDGDKSIFTNSELFSYWWKNVKK